MEDNQNPQDQNIKETIAAPVQPGSARPSRTVIQPINDMSEYVQQLSQPTGDTLSAPPTTNVETAHRPDPSKIYPDIGQQNTGANPGTIQQEKPTDSGRVASKVPALQVYAFLIIIYSVYSLLVYSSVMSTLVRFQSTRTTSMLLVAAAIVNIILGIYFLIAKSAKTVSALMTALLIVGGISLLNSLASLVRLGSRIGSNSIVAIIISIGLLLYLWSVKTQVDTVD